uniref:IF rod domain-containing protein n=1 Tax=Terrapene triunguis TaxID=2587831 RepID=A0A674IGX2_9SAUR
MSYTSDLLYPPSSYKKIFGETSRLSSRVYSSPAPPRAAGYRAHHARDSYPTSYRKLAGPSSANHLELLSQSSAVSNELKIVRTNEKEQLQGLNDRFVTYIEKVHQLEQHNRLLEAEVSLLRQRQAEPSRLQQLYEQEIRELRSKVEELRHERDEAQLESQQLAQGLQRLREQCQEEARRREEAELALREYRKDVDHATLARLELEKKVESLLDEIAFLRKVHEEEVAELQASLQDAQVSVEVDVSKPDLTAALKEIRMQYEVLSARNQQSAEEWYKSKFANFTEEAARSSDSIRQAKEEITEYRRQLQARNIEVEALRNANESLERQLQEAEERSNGEIHNLQETINQLENALRTTKGEMARHLREYQDLLNVKMALDIEIAQMPRFDSGLELVKSPHPPLLLFLLLISSYANAF